MLSIVAALCVLAALRVLAALCVVTAQSVAESQALEDLQGGTPRKNTQTRGRGVWAAWAGSEHEREASSKRLAAAASG